MIITTNPIIDKILDKRTIMKDNGNFFICYILLFWNNSSYFFLKYFGFGLS